MEPQPFEPGPHSHLFMLWYFWPNHWLRKHMPIWQPSVFTQYPRWSYFVFDQKSISKTIWPSIWKLEIKAFQFSVAWRHCQILFLGVSCLLHPKDLWCDVNIYIYIYISFVLLLQLRLQLLERWRFRGSDCKIEPIMSSFYLLFQKLSKGFGPLQWPFEKSSS